MASNVETDEAIDYICYLAAFDHRMAESGSGQEKRYGAEEGAARSNRRNHYYHTACMTHGRPRRRRRRRSSYPFTATMVWDMNKKSW